MLNKWAMTLVLTALILAGCNDENSADFSLELLGTYHSGVFDESAAEISAFDAETQRLFVVNGDSKQVDVLDVSEPSAPSKVNSIDVTLLGKAANSVAVHDGVVAVAIEADLKQNPGTVAFYQADNLSLIDSYTVGALPDMVTFTPDGEYALVANEGEPSDDYANDPEGSISIIHLGAGIAAATVSTADFTDFDGDEDDLNANNVRIFGPSASASQDIEPEYIAVSSDSKTAWVALQENNALAIVDVAKAEVTDLVSFGLKDHSLPGNGFDASDRDDAINITTWPVLGMYQPDAIAAFEVDGVSYLVTANEGDARDYDGFSEEERVKDLSLDPVVFAPNVGMLQADENIGRLKTTLATGDFDADGQHERIFSYGARSFSVWDAKGNQLWDSGSEFEEILSNQYPEFFNSSNDSNKRDNRSDDKGVEPEAITTAVLNGKTYAFIGLERFGGVMVYDISKPTAPSFVTFELNRDFTVDPEDDLKRAGDLGPEGILVITAEDSPNGKPLLVVSNEVSGTVSLYQINP